MLLFLFFLFCCDPIGAAAGSTVLGILFFPRRGVLFTFCFTRRDL